MERMHAEYVKFCYIMSIVAYIIACRMNAVSKRLGRRIYKHIFVFDLAGIGMKHLSRNLISFLKPIFDLGQVYYPESLFRMYLVNAPLIFWGTWKIISGLIDPETREKIGVLVSTLASMTYSIIILLILIFTCRKILQHF